MTDILFPVGRMVGGSMYRANVRKNKATKQPELKNGHEVVSYGFGVAIAKTQAAWQNEVWGAQIKAVGDAGHPGISMRPDYSWKIIDGDSVIPNTKNKRPCDQEGHPGNWVLWFSQSWAPKLVNANGTLELTEPDAIMPGYYIQVFGSVKDNGPSESPGVYLNPLAVALAGFGPRIVSSDVDTTTVGFGGGALPPGASSVPVGAMPVPGAAPNAPAASYAPAAPMVPPLAPVAPPVVTPNPAILHVPQRVMQPSAGGATYEALIAQGWTDALLLQHGHMKMV
jgi:hypothetical protein